MSIQNRNYANRLLVEGADDKRLLPELMERLGVRWGDSESERIVDVKNMEGVSNLLADGVIEAECKASGIKRLGIIVDADLDAVSRWEEVRNRVSVSVPNCPQELPTTGLVYQSERLRVGVWIMPDNSSRGMLETFMLYLIENDDSELFAHAKASAEKAATDFAAKFKDAHFDKAAMHTWLAWQDPPGRQTHQAVKERIFQADTVQSRLFLQWFVNLFEIQSVGPP